MNWLQIQWRKTFAHNRIKFCGLVSFYHILLFSSILVFKFNIKIAPKPKMKIHSDKFYCECIFEMKEWNWFNRCKRAKTKWSVANLYMMFNNLLQWVYGYTFLLLTMMLKYMDFNVLSINASCLSYLYCTRIL